MFLLPEIAKINYIFIKFKIILLFEIQYYKLFNNIEIALWMSLHRL